MEHEGKWIIYNPGTDLMFAECGECGFEDNDQLFITLLLEGNQCICHCPKCKARLTAWELAEEGA